MILVKFSYLNDNKTEVALSEQYMEHVPRVGDVVNCAGCGEAYLTVTQVWWNVSDTFANIPDDVMCPEWPKPDPDFTPWVDVTGTLG